MNDINLRICGEIEDHLNDDMESNAKKLIERDQLLESEMRVFEQSLSSDQLQHWDIIRNQVDNMRMYAKLGKIRLMENDEEVGGIIDQYKKEFESSDELQEAALQIHKEMHEPSGITGIVKSLFMWKDTPVERVEDNKQQ